MLEKLVAAPACRLPLLRKVYGRALGCVLYGCSVGLGQQPNVVGMELLPQSVLGLCLLTLTRLLGVTFLHDGEVVVNRDLKGLAQGTWNGSLHV